MLGAFVLSGPCGREEPGKSTAKTQRREGLTKTMQKVGGGNDPMIGVLTHFSVTAALSRSRLFPGWAGDDIRSRLHGCRFFRASRLQEVTAELGRGWTLISRIKKQRILPQESGRPGRAEFVKSWTDRRVLFLLERLTPVLDFPS